MSQNQSQSTRADREPREASTRERKKRIPAGQPRQVLPVEGIPEGYVGYWAKEEQFDELLDAGYEFVTSGEVRVGSMKTEGDQMGSKVKHVGKRGSTVYLMKIRKDWYDENQAVKQAAIDRVDKQIHRGKFQTDGMNYAPGNIIVDNETKN